VDRTEQEAMPGSVTITLQKNNTNVGPLTVAITPLTIEEFNAMSFTLPAEFADVFPPDGPDPAECKYKYLIEIYPIAEMRHASGIV